MAYNSGARELAETVTEFCRQLFCSPVSLPLGFEKDDLVLAWNDPRTWPREAKDLFYKVLDCPDGHAAPWEPEAAETPCSLEKLDRKCRLSGCCFTDRAFQVSTSWSVTQAVRPHRITRHEGRAAAADWQLFRGRPRADDVQQGRLGDCWFLSALAALAEFRNGDLVHKLLPGQEAPSSSGAYLVRLCLGGRWRGVVVDDQLPCTGGGLFHAELAHCVTKRQQLWASIIEKAFAKACGSYEAIVGGEATEALEVLTGCPCAMTIFGHPDFNPELLWATLRSSRDKSFLMTCSTKTVHSRSLEHNHVYTLLDVQEVLDTRGRPVRLLKIRNPHPATKWDGDWSDHSPLWTPQLRAQLQCPEGGTPQVFFMAFQDFLREFSHCTVCRARGSEWHEARHPLQLPGGSMVPSVGVEVEASGATECCVSLVQPGKRLHGGPKTPACMGFVLLPLGRAARASAPAAVAAAQLRHESTASADCTLPAGRYLLVPLSMHGGSAVEATAAFATSRGVTLQERALDVDEVRLAWAAYARETDPEGVHFHGSVLRFGKSDKGSVVATAENPTERLLEVQLDFRSESLRFSRGASGSTDWLQPFTGQVLQVAQPDLTGDKPVAWQQSHRFRMSCDAHKASRHSPPLSSGVAGDLHAPFQLAGPTSSGAFV